MRKIKLIIFLLMIVLSTSSCSIIPKIKFGTPSTVPQAIDKSKAKEICKGKAVWGESGEMISCSSGYYKYEEGYAKKERSMTVIERIKDFINNLAGWSFWIFVAMIFLCPGLLGAIVGRLIEATIGLTGKTLRATIRGVQRARKNNENLDTALSAEQDKVEKQYVEKVKKQEKLK